MGLAIKAENLSKAYQLGEFSTGTISQDIERWWLLMRGKEDPFLKIGERNDRTVKGTSDIVWSLKDINFEINQGDAVGIIGKNGAGKSTLLKVLSRVTSPTTGSIKVKGRIASLLEVGTGFHPELTGRENIFLNGAILGMRKHEIKKHFDAIVEFAGVERYIDTPVKRYSSGMYVRLAFAVAAHLESEILIVDEVLAVGDAEFQKKCLGKMGEVSRGEGRTVLFVSHNLESVLKLCSSCIYMENGQISKYGKTGDIINAYLTSSRLKQQVLSLVNVSRPTNMNLGGRAAVKSVQIVKSAKGIELWKLEYKEVIHFLFEVEVYTPLQSLEIGIGLFNSMDFEVASPLSTDYTNFLNLDKGTYQIDFSFVDFYLLPNIYKAAFGIRSESGFEDYVPAVCEFEVITSSISAEAAASTRNGFIVPKINCSIHKYEVVS